MKVKQLEKLQNKIGLMGCKWSSLNAPGHWISSLSLRLGESHSLMFLGNKGNGLPSMKVQSWIEAKFIYGAYAKRRDDEM